ncbi:predicted protein [Nematostella vectensis]|uniref:G-protein coupled receptors family 1 profile domain-containing protein n=1 Tax=Nematostella vectensis TaxID=45351 RepID=A7SKF4_NEMVE|nr:predicted protein [Nematostella vectensis]|eukprot:XP_001627892.1 predicted protein [Nematostella vectensis]
MGVIHDWETPRLGLLYWLLIAEGFVIFLSNILTLITFATNRALRKRSTYFLIAVAAADAMVGLAAIFCYSFVLIDKYISGWRFAGDVLWIACSTASINGLVLIAIERLHATVRPLRHRQVQPRAYFYGIVAQWAIALPLGLSYAATDEAIITIWSRNVLAFSSLAVICCSYFIILVNVRKQRIKLSHPSTRRDRELAETLFIVTALSLVTWLPDLIFHEIPRYTRFLLAHELVMAWRLLNSVVNPVVYALRMPDFRKAMVKIVCS